MNAIFHLGSAVAAVFLIYLLLRTRRQCQLLQMLLRAGAQPTAQVAPVPTIVANPKQWLKAFATALSVPFEAEETEGAPGLAPVRIDQRFWADLFLSRGLTLIRWKAPRPEHSERGKLVEVELHIVSTAADATWQSRLEKALGGSIGVCVVASGSAVAERA